MRPTRGFGHLQLYRLKINGKLILDYTERRFKRTSNLSQTESDNTETICSRHESLIDSEIFLC